MTSGPITSWQIDGETVETVTVLSWAPKSLQMVTAVMKLRHLIVGRKAVTSLDSILKRRDIKKKKQRHYFANKGLSSQNFGFSNSHLWMWELDYRESWALKNWCFWTVVLEKTLESPLDRKESNQYILKENSPEYSLVGLMLKLKLQSFGHLMWRTDSLEKPGLLQSMGLQTVRHNWVTELNWKYSLT